MLGLSHSSSTFFMFSSVTATRNKKLLGAPGRTTRSKKLLGAKGIATRSKDATFGALRFLNLVQAAPRCYRACAAELQKWHCKRSPPWPRQTETQQLSGVQCYNMTTKDNGNGVRRQVVRGSKPVGVAQRNAFLFVTFGL